MKFQPVVLAMALALGCGPHIPKKPAGVPENALWAWDADRGAFVLVVAPDHEGWQVKIFDDHTGAVLGQGLYVIHGGIARPSFSQDDFTTWDGKAVHLKDGGVLVPKNPS